MTAWPVAVSQWVTREPDPVRAAERVAAAGYGAFEPAADPAIDAAALARALDALGLLASSLCAVYSLERDCAAEAPGPRRAARDYLASCVELADALGSPVLVVVPTYRVEWDVDRAAELARAAETIRAVAERVPAGGPLLAIEPLNRYETHLVRTVADAQELRALVGHPQVAVMADLFHMQIEEDDPPATLRRHAATLAHVHLADSQRRAPGTGHLDFGAALGALRDSGYGGALAMEFLPADEAALRAGRAHVEEVLARC